MKFIFTDVGTLTEVKNYLGKFTNELRFYYENFPKELHKDNCDDWKFFFERLFNWLNEYKNSKEYNLLHEYIFSGKCKINFFETIAFYDGDFYSNFFTELRSLANGYCSNKRAISIKRAIKQAIYKCETELEYMDLTYFW